MILLSADARAQQSMVLGLGDSFTPELVQGLRTRGHHPYTWSTWEFDRVYWHNELPEWNGMSASGQRAAIRHTIANGGKIFFVVDGVSAENFSASGLPRGAWNHAAGYTNSELRQ